MVEVINGYVDVLAQKFESALQCLVAEELQKEGSEVTRENMLAFKKEAKEDLLVLYNGQGEPVAVGTKWLYLLHKAAQKTYA